MKLSTKIKAIAMPIGALSLASAPIFMATSCSKNYETLFFTVTNNKGLEVEFCDVGASIANLKLGSTYLTYHPKDRATFVDYEATPYYYGKILGRVAGRFEDGKFSFQGDSTVHQLQVNEKSKTKNNCLHGGNDALSFKTFKRDVITEEKTGNTIVKFTYTSPDGEAGFPGEVDITAIYKIYKDENRIDTTLKATPKAKTLINLSTHSLFRLGNEGDVLDYELTIPSTYRVEYNKEAQNATGQLPIGLKLVDAAAQPDDRGIYDFSPAVSPATQKTIGKDIEKSAVRDGVSGGYDHIWYVGNIDTTAGRYVNLYNPANDLNFRVTALNKNVTGFILYSNDYPRAGQLMSDDDYDKKWAGITIEPYTYFTAKKDTTKQEGHVPGLEPITYGPNIEGHKEFETSYSYEITLGRHA